MTLTKNQWIIVVVVALIVIWYFFIRKKITSGSESSYKVTVPPALNNRCNCIKRLPDGSTAYGKYNGQRCDFQGDCFPPTTLKDNARKN
ncbi:MAG: hypothetical protein EXR20_07115 [Bacteroidetes bacterium]|jgi:hypothetical protein|nr:hypothetical protein [Bacteroidota bacterium]